MSEKWHSRQRTGQLTVLLVDWANGDPSALDALVPLVAAKLRRLARRRMAQEGAGHTLQPTALIHEVFMRLVEGPRIDWQNRAHFFAVAARLMRRVLVDHARAKRNLKRGGTWTRVELADASLLAHGEAPDVIALDDALSHLAAIDPRRSRVVELRFFGGLTEREIALVLNVSRETVIRDWKLARAWLARELQKGRDHDA